MFKGNSSSLLSKNSVHLVCHGHVAVMSPCAAESHRKAVLAFLDVTRNQFFDELCSSVDEFLGDIVFQDILRDLFVVTCELFKARGMKRTSRVQSVSRGMPCL